jgi:hypothetical protein
MDYALSVFIKQQILISFKLLSRNVLVSVRYNIQIITECACPSLEILFYQYTLYIAH